MIRKPPSAAVILAAASTLSSAQFAGFAPRVDYPMDPTYDPTGSVLADLDNDGDLDLACSVFSPATWDYFVVAFNNGDGTYGPFTAWSVGSSPTAITAADINLDGKVDILTSNRDSNDFSLRLNNGDGSFGPEIFRSTGERPQSIVVADFNNDAKPDVAVCNEFDDTVSVFFGDGSGNFGAEMLWPTTAPGMNNGLNPRGINTADLNNDGVIDIITANTNSQTGTILYGVAETPGSFFAGEFGTYVQTGPTPVHVVAEDLDNDGNKDLVFCNGGNGTLTIRFNEAGGAAFPIFPNADSITVGGRPISVIAADFDDLEADADRDLVVADELNSRLIVLLNDGTGTFTNAGLFDAGPSPQDHSTADIDGDGDIDIVTPQYTNNAVSVLMNLSTIIGGPRPIVRIDAPTPAGTVGGCACANHADIIGVAYVPDGLLDNYTVEYRPVTSPGAWATMSISSTPVTEPGGTLASWNTAGLSEGRYMVRLTATNAGGLSASDETVIYVSKNYNSASFVIAGGMDSNGEIINATSVSGTACIHGSANDDWCGPNSYTVDYRSTSDTIWYPVDPTTPVYTGDRLNDTLATWDTTYVPDGVYEIRVSAENGCGDSKSFVEYIAVDNTPPTAEIDSPINCDWLSQNNTLPITGTAKDANLDQWNLYYTGGPYNNWIPIASGSNNVVGDVLADWDTSSLPPCSYTLLLRVIDKSYANCGNSRRYTDHMVTVNIGCRADLAEPYQLLDLADIVEFVTVFNAGCQ